MLNHDEYQQKWIALKKKLVNEAVIKKKSATNKKRARKLTQHYSPPKRIDLTGTSDDEKTKPNNKKKKWRSCLTLLVRLREVMGLREEWNRLRKVMGLREEWDRAENDHKKRLDHPMGLREEWDRLREVMGLRGERKRVKNHRKKRLNYRHQKTIHASSPKMMYETSSTRASLKVLRVVFSSTGLLLYIDRRIWVWETHGCKHAVVPTHTQFGKIYS